MMRTPQPVSRSLRLLRRPCRLPPDATALSDRLPAACRLRTLRTIVVARAAGVAITCELRRPRIIVIWFRNPVPAALLTGEVVVASLRFLHDRRCLPPHTIPPNILYVRGCTAFPQRQDDRGHIVRRFKVSKATAGRESRESICRTAQSAARRVMNRVKR